MTPESAALKVKKPQVCTHCSSELMRFGRPVDDFCCLGCQTAHHLIQSSGLGDYYAIRNDVQKIREVSLAQSIDPRLVSSWKEIDQTALDVYLENVHCTACVWLIEKLPEVIPGVSSSRLDLGNSVAKIEVDDARIWPQVLHWLNDIGYTPHLLSNQSEAEERRREEAQRYLKGIGVAAVCAGNIMLLAIADYAGATPRFVTVFRWIQAFLILPVLLYSSKPFFKSAWSALLRFRPTIDLPIALAIVIGTAASVFNLLSRAEAVYFDSIAVLVFLILLSRYFVKKLQWKALQKTDLALDYLPKTVTKVSPLSKTHEIVPIQNIDRGDFIWVKSQEVIPVDGIVHEGRSHVDDAVLTGESKPRLVHLGDRVLAGSLNSGSPLMIEVSASGKDTEFKKTVDQTIDLQAKKNDQILVADRFAQVLVVFSVVGFFALLLFANLDRALALVIVACPCALALATPLATRSAMRKLLKEGALVKSPEMLDAIVRSKEILFDKTGTLTQGEFQVLEWNNLGEKESTEAAIFALESHSHHPIAKAILKHIRLSENPLTVEAFRVLPRGIQGKINGSTWKIVPDDSAQESSPSGTLVQAICDDQMMAKIRLGDRVRPDAVSTLHDLKDLGYRVQLVSGDNPANCKAFARQVGLQADVVFGGMTPQSKQEHVANAHPAIFVGDGLNDAPSLSRAAVGVAVHGGISLSLFSAGVYLIEPRLESVVELIRIAKRTQDTIRLNLRIALVYNLGAGIAAILGWISPLTAAILMPISSISVVSLTHWRMNR